jgi:hypothetical protein
MRGAIATYALGAMLVAASAVSAVRTADAAPLAREDIARLEAGELLTFPKTIETERRRYVGGVGYLVLEATPAEMMAVFSDARAYREVLPRTKDARLVPGHGPNTRIAVRQGTALVEAEYTLLLHHDPGRHTTRFWLDPTRPHGIDDAWGFFRYEPLSPSEGGAPRVLLTYGVLIDLGHGLVRQLFEERIHAVMMEVPHRLREYLAADGSASSRRKSSRSASRVW